MQYFSPKTQNELQKLLIEYGSQVAIISGCTDALIKKDFFKNKKAIIDITSIPEYQKIEEQEDKIVIGAAVTFDSIIQSELITQYSPILIDAAKLVGSVQIRTRATLAGNIVNASPAADSAPVLMVSNASLVLFSKRGKRTISIKDFFTGPGKTTLNPGEVLTHVIIDKDKESTIGFYKKIGTRKALSIAKASMALKAKKENGKLSNVAIAYGSVGPTIINSQQAVAILENNTLNNDLIELAANKAYDEVTPITDIRSTENYRKLIIKNMLIEELSKLTQH